MSAGIIEQKIARLRAGGRPRVLDFFAGCGGLSLGFATAGFEITAAVENDPDAAASHGRNFHGGDPLHCTARDIRDTKPEHLVAELQLGKVAGAFDVIVGGPPCQAFARVGRPSYGKLMLIPGPSSMMPAPSYTPIISNTWTRVCHLRY